MKHTTHSHILQSGLHTFDLLNFHVHTLTIESDLLKSSQGPEAPAESAIRRNPVLVPKDRPPENGWPVVLVLSGFMSNGTNALNIKTFELNSAQTIDRAVSIDEAPKSIYVFCDAMTRWGGSQFVDSRCTGPFAAYILDELCPAVRHQLPASFNPDFWCVAGGSSGGYGALHLSTLRAGSFGAVVAIAPDCFFEASLLPEIRAALPHIIEIGGIDAVAKELASGRFLRRKEAHTVLNAIAMGLCYGPNEKSGVEWPIDTETGLVIPEVWSQWLRHDPIFFIRERAKHLRQIKKIYIDVGTRDQFNLQYGARQIRDQIRSLGCNLTYSEFVGGHFDIGERRVAAWKWLKSEWQCQRSES